MEVKKSPKADLENKKFLFAEVGLAITLGVLLLAFNWTTTDTVNVDMVNAPEAKVEQEIVPVTNQDEVKQPEPPKVVAVSDVIKVVADNVNINDNTDIFENDFKEDASVQIMQFSDEEEEAEEQPPFVIVEEMPGFGDGDINEFRINYVQKNLKYPDVAAENGIQGRVYVNFVVEPDGRVTHVKVVRGVDPALDKEAVRVVSASPRWRPGKQRGKPVRVQFTIPIIFVLQ
ncbi:MAG: energy transducer TonB [Bacteroidales bacterium]|nr:energy transducer TonB [Bacteroidales bacterium]HPD96182.1 TonB family protein [Tenuifilaceae bacterium]HRX30288.1 TonB family protein [Tenuifilaceae bacterium]